MRYNYRRTPSSLRVILNCVAIWDGTLTQKKFYDEDKIDYLTIRNPQSAMPITVLPFNLPGHVFRSPMPFGHFDRGGDTLALFRQNGVQLVVMLVEEEEHHRLSGRDLKALYAEEGFEVLNFPISDYGVPKDRQAFEGAVASVLAEVRGGKNIVIHCFAGVGRTGIFLAAMAQDALGKGGEEAIRWVREYVDGAVEMETQKQFILQRESKPNQE